MKKVLKRFEVDYIQVLDKNGNCDKKLMPMINDSEIKKMYELMVLTRTFDDKAVKLQRQGRIGTYASVKGEEACQIGSAIQLSKEDYVFPAFREHGVFLTLGIKPDQIFQYWGGDERGSAFPKDINLLPVCIPIASHLPHAVGAGMAFNYLKRKNVSVVYFGDGATSEGDFHAAMNFAGEYKAPTIFICQNNQWAISTPVKEQTASFTLAQKAIAYGFEGIQIDGNDLFAVYKTTQEAIKKARSGGGPTFIECFTYRLGDHTTSDDASKYRAEKEVKEWERKDPILRLKRYMLKNKLLNEKTDIELIKKYKKQVDEAVEKYEKIEPQTVEEIFKYTYASMTDELKEEMEMLKNELNEGK